MQEYEPWDHRFDRLAPISLQDSIPCIEAAYSLNNLGPLLPLAD
jgi:hypothetical protein